jgi:hypothetical protein
VLRRLVMMVLGVVVGVGIATVAAAPSGVARAEGYWLTAKACPIIYPEVVSQRVHNGIRSGQLGPPDPTFTDKQVCSAVYQAEKAELARRRHRVHTSIGAWNLSWTTKRGRVTYIGRPYFEVAAVWTVRRREL